MGVVKKAMLGFILTLVSCSIMKDDKIGLNRLDYIDNGVRLEGYYYKELESDVPRISIYFFYRNGIALYGEAPSLSNLIANEEKFKSGQYYNRVKNNKTGWGVFQINGSAIEFEIWGPNNGGRLKTNLRSGIILNDSTFLINSLFSNYDGQTTVEEDTFHFKEFSPKPDSTNTFIN